MKEHLSLITSFDVISFDIFDTLLVRNVLNPKDVWRILEQKELAPGFFSERDAADRATYAAATVRGGEHTLDEAYAMMGTEWAEYKRKELEAECRVLFVNPEILDVWNEAGRLGKKRVLVSDMYLPRVEIEKILNSKGISGWDAVFVSSEHGCRKTTGKLFEVMLKKMSAQPERVMHIGDNRKSDFEVPQGLGMTALLYPKIKDRFFDECPLTREFLSYRPSFEKNRIVGALAQRWHMFKCEHPDSTFWHKIGFFYGGVLGFAYVRWIGHEARTRGFTHLMFVGRDGYIWQKMAQALFPDLRSDYFYAPRTMSVRVLGAVGNDPYAVRDRQRYMDESLRDNDPGKAKAEYAAYLAPFKIDQKKTALIDGMSSGFSAQRLVEKTIGAEVFTFYLLAYVPPKPGAGFYESVRMCGISFQNFSEFIFSSPEPPLERVDATGPVFASHVDVFEQIKISHAEEIAEAALACAKALGSADVIVSPQDVQDFFDAGMRTLSVEDRFRLSVARNSTDVAHRRYRPIDVQPRERCRIRISFLGVPILTVRYAWRDGWFCRTLLFLGRIPIFFRKAKIYRFAEAASSRSNRPTTIRGGRHEA